MLAAFAAALCAPALAGMEDREARTKPTKVESMARIVDRSKSSSLRCFQEGKLVFESAGVEPASEAHNISVLKAGTNRSIQLIDLRHGICIVDYTNG
ncbi:MAG: hypothetical protein R3E87_06255 [Burkholderiaceae bacterium]